MHHAPRYGIYQEKRTAPNAAAALSAAAATTRLAVAAAAGLMSLLLSIMKGDRDRNWKAKVVSVVVAARNHAK